MGLGGGRFAGFTSGILVLEGTVTDKTSGLLGVESGISTITLVSLGCLGNVTLSLTSPVCLGNNMSVMRG